MGPGHGRGVERPALLALRGSAARATPLVRASSSRDSIVARIVRGRTTVRACASGTGLTVGGRAMSPMGYSLGERVGMPLRILL